MDISQAIKRAKVRAKSEALTNDYGDSMMFVVYDDDYQRCIVLNEWHYDLSQGIGDTDQAVASIWSDGQSVEVERY